MEIIERRKVRVLDSAYRGGSMTLRSMKQWNPALGSARTDLSDIEKDTLTARSRDADRNGLGRAVHDRIPLNAVGTGLDLQASPDYRGIGITKEEAGEKAREIEREFSMWEDSCDIERRLNFKMAQYLIMTSTLISGDVFINTPYLRRDEDVYGLKIQIIEADRVRNPNNFGDTDTLHAGIEVDKYGSPIFYHIMRFHPGETLLYTPNDWDKVPVFNQDGNRRVMHSYLVRRPGQERGEPILAPILETLKQIDRYRANELMAAVVASMFTAFIKTDVGTGLPILGNGAVVGIAPDEDVVIANPGRPNSQYMPFMDAAWKEIGSVTGVPYEELLQIYQSSYSASRAAIIQAWRLYKFRRAWLVNQVIQPLYQLFLDEAVALGRIKLDGYADRSIRFSWSRADWTGPSMADIDPEKTVNAAEKRMRLGITNLAIETTESTGRDWEDVNDQALYIKGIQKKSGVSTQYSNQESQEGSVKDALQE